MIIKLALGTDFMHLYVYRSMQSSWARQESCSWQTSFASYQVKVSAVGMEIQCKTMGC